MKVWEKVFGVQRVGIDDEFFALGGQSLMSVRLISEINRNFDVSIDVIELFQNPTMARMAGIIDKQRPNGKRRPKVVELRSGLAETPVYFIYAGPDEYRLAQLMDTSHPVYGIEVPWPMDWRSAVAENRRSAYPTMEQFVAPYVTALADHVGSSTCVLAGHSFAGLMAFEAAHQFQNQGGKVEMVILLDTQSRHADPLEAAWIKFQQTWVKRFDRRSAGRHSTSVVSRLRLSLRIVRWLLGEEKTRVLSFVKRLVSNRTALNPENLTTLLDEQACRYPGNS